MLRPLAVSIVCAALSLGASAQGLTVSAAASLAGAMREITAAFGASRPGLAMHLNLAGSNALLAQIAQGAPVDVFASADLETMDRAEARSLVVPGTRRNFTRNTLVLVAPRAAAPAIDRLGDLADPRVGRVAIGNPLTVPVGRYARSVLQREGLWAALQGKLVFAEDVRQVLGYVERGEVDAGFVYRSDALGASAAVRTVATLADAGPVHYPIAVVAGSRQPAAAADFIAFVNAAPAQAILARHGFLPP